MHIFPIAEGLVEMAGIFELLLTLNSWPAAYDDVRGFARLGGCEKLTEHPRPLEHRA